MNVKQILIIINTYQSLFLEFKIVVQMKILLYTKSLR